MPTGTSSSAQASLEDLEVPAIVVDIDGTELTSNDEQSTIASVEVDLALDRPGRVLVATTDLAADEVEWVDSSAVQEGRPITISVGGGPGAAVLFTGDVTGLEFEAEDDGDASVTICGYDRLHRLARARRTAAFVGKTDSQIAADIADKHALKVTVGPDTDSSVVHPYVMQRQQTDLAFLRERARRIGYVIRVEGDELVFAPRALADSAAAVAKFGDNLLELRVTTSLLGQVGAAEALGWDPDEQKSIAKQVTAPRSTMGGQKTGLELADSLYKAQVTAATGSVITLEEHAEQVAAAELEDIALRHVTCRGNLLGTPELRPGMILDIDVTSRRIKGSYYLTHVTHSWSPEGFYTRFVGRRTAT